MEDRPRHHRLRAAHLSRRTQVAPAGYLDRQPALPHQRRRFVSQAIPARRRGRQARDPPHDPACQCLPRHFLFPPLLRQEILDAKSTTGEHVLVYVTSPAPELAKLLGTVRCRFIAYGFGREGRNETGNILYKKPSLDGFFADLTSSSAIVANSGFSLVTEALHLGKPYLAVPVNHQFEQIFNAYWLEKSGYGAYWEQLDKERVEAFLYNVPHYREALAAYPRTGNRALLEKLDALIAGYTAV